MIHAHGHSGSNQKSATVRPVAAVSDRCGRSVAVGHGGSRDRSPRDLSPYNPGAPPSVSHSLGHRRSAHSLSPGPGPTSGRPAVRRTPATPKASDTAASVSTSSTGPAPPARPARSRAAWVTPGGISSRWWVTRTMGGTAGSAASAARRASRPSRAPRSSPAAGSSIRISSGSPISARASRTCWRSPSDSRPNARSANTVAPEPGVGQQGAGPGPVVVGVLVPPRLECGVTAGQHDVERGLGRAQGPAHRCADHGDPPAELAHVDPAEALAQDLDRAPGRPQARRPTTRSRVVLPEPLGPSSAHRSPGPTVQVMSSSRATPSRTTATPSRRTAGGTAPVTLSSVELSYVEAERGRHGWLPLGDLGRFHRHWDGRSPPVNRSAMLAWIVDG